MSDNQFSHVTSVGQLLGELAGGASVCWENLNKAGVFQSEDAKALVDDAIERLGQLDNVYVFPEGYVVERGMEHLHTTEDRIMRNVDTGVLLSNGSYFIRHSENDEEAVKNAAHECQRVYGFRPNLEVVRVGHMTVFAKQIVAGVNDNA